MSALFDALDDEEKKIIASVVRGVDVTEIYSPERVNKLAAKMGRVPLTNGWDFSREDHRRRAWRLIKETKPYMVIGSPPCTMFSMLQELNLHLHKDDAPWMAEFDRKWRFAVQHIEFCAQIYRLQMNEGRHFIHEHPRDAKSWDLPVVKDLLNDPRLNWVEGHMCAFDMTAPISGSNGEVGYAKKPTGFMTNSICIARKLTKRCLYFFIN